jgi:hypothetical protein
VRYKGLALFGLGTLAGLSLTGLANWNEAPDAENESVLPPAAVGSSDVPAARAAPPTDPERVYRGNPDSCFHNMYLPCMFI